MKKVNNAKLIVGISNILLISGVAAKTISLFWIVMWIISIFVVVKVVPYTKGYESMWVFVLTAISSVPINIVLTCNIMKSGFFDGGFPVVGRVMSLIEIYILLSGLEQILIGFLTLVTWKKQRKIHEVLQKEGADL